MHSAVARSGPNTKVSSSVTDSKAAAVVIRGESWSFTPQRARTMGPTWGTEAPVGTAARKRAHKGASISASAVRERPATVCTRTPGNRTARWPWRSARRPVEGREQRHGDAGDGGDRAGRPRTSRWCAGRGVRGRASASRRADVRRSREQERPGAPRVRSSCPYPGREVTVDATARALLLVGAAPFVERFASGRCGRCRRPTALSPSASARSTSTPSHPFGHSPCGGRRELSSCAELR